MMALATNVPLIESGTAGYLGQMSVHVKGETQCYDCEPKEADRKTYPICTIRSTPSAPVHCIVWAKSFLFSQLFGMPTESKAEDSESSKIIEELRQEEQELQTLRDSLGHPDFAQKGN